MRHLIRINVRGNGYSLYSHTPGHDVRQHPLDVQSSALPPGFLPAQRHIDELLEQRPLRVCVAVSAPGSGGGALAVWGCQLPLPDEHGRFGLTFVHGIEGDRRQVLDLVSRVIALASPDNLEKIGRLVGGIATGTAKLDELLVELDWCEEFRPLPEGREEPHPPAFGSIVHDCGGAPLAWLAMVREHSATSGSWEVHDTLLQDGRIATVASTQPLPRVMLSELLRTAARPADSPAPVNPVPASVSPRSLEVIVAPEPRTRTRPWGLIAAIAACLAVSSWAITGTGGETQALLATTQSLLDTRLTLTADPAILRNRSVYLVFRRDDGRVYPQSRCETQNLTVTCTPSHVPPRGHSYSALLVFVEKKHAPVYDDYVDQDPFPRDGLEDLPGPAAAQLAVSSL